MSRKNVKLFTLPWMDGFEIIAKKKFNGNPLCENLSAAISLLLPCLFHIIFLLSLFFLLFLSLLYFDLWLYYGCGKA